MAIVLWLALPMRSGPEARSARHVPAPVASASSPGAADVGLANMRPRIARAPTVPQAAVVASVPQRANDEAMSACHEANARAMQARARQLAGSRDARDRVVHALTLTTNRPGLGVDRPRAALTAAAAAAPADPWIAWTAAQYCTAPACDRQAAIAHLLRLDSDNAFAWLLAVDEEHRRGDLVQAERLLQRAARAPRLDAYWAMSSRLVFERFGPMPLPAACDKVAAKLGEALSLHRPVTADDLMIVQAVALVGMQMPPLRSILDLCPARRDIPAHRQSACRAVFARMAGSAELLYQLIGARGLESHANTATERARWRERRRNLAWLSQEAGWRIATSAHQRLIWEQGEVAVMIAALEAAGRWPAPPGWLPRSFDGH